MKKATRKKSTKRTTEWLDAVAAHLPSGTISKSSPLVCGNVIGSSAALLVAALESRLEGRSFVLVSPTAAEARALAEDLAFFGAGRSPFYLPTADEGGFFGKDDVTAFGRRLEAAKLIADRAKSVLVSTSVAALLDGMPDPDDVARRSLALAIGDRRDRDDVADTLAGAGFVRAPLVEGQGQFSVRGAILDVFDHVGTHPYRIEFDDDRVESIRAFDHASQLSIRPLQGVGIALTSPEGSQSSGVNRSERSFVDLAPDGTVFALRDEDLAHEALERHVEQTAFDGRDVCRNRFDELTSLVAIRLSRLPVDPAIGRDLDIGIIGARGTDLTGAVETLEACAALADATHVCFASEPERHRFWESIDEEYGEEKSTALRAMGVHDEIGVITSGFRFRSLRLVFVNHRELFNISVVRRTHDESRRPKSRAIDDFVDLKDGDYVVHVAHGIARYLGIENIQKGGEEQEFLVLEFADEVRIYVPVSRADLVQKYIGGKGEAPPLSKVGGRSWAKKKDEVFRAVTDLAQDLLETQAVRARQEGFAFPKDTSWQHEFEAAFPYQETADQLDAVAAIKNDMEAPRPMDRLICGDVGYGKTEVAMRAVFKCVMSGKQAAILVPTTVLAEQHAVTFAERMANWPVRVGCLSRFKTEKEQSGVIVGLVEGKVDVAIGTHRLLSTDVQFKDLGLVVIDEEQRFGVAHKEKLRTLKRRVDVLTLTATPIPRTLNMAMLGIRDISSLTQPPRGRQAVETKVINYDPGAIRTAILHELERGGQCFFVHNRVHSIDKVRKELSSIVPGARTIIVHGQMKDHEIEANMRAFVHREADILLATTIIESGLDIPSANTIFIDRPDMYGLADMHQLRGRVGRYHDRAYCYLLLRPDSILTDDTEKRLRAIEEYNELGSGFRIAMRDLEIRGAGNILGHEQHGHIAAVGYDMFCRLLEVAVKRLKNERAVMPGEVDIHLDFEAMLPDDYVPDPKLKLEMYRKLGRARDDAEIDELFEEMRDRFGSPPIRAEEFVDVCRIRAYLERQQIASIKILPDHGLLLRPHILKAAQRRLFASAFQHRIIGGKDVLLVHPDPFPGARAVLETLRAAFEAKSTRT